MGGEGLIIVKKKPGTPKDRGPAKVFANQSGRVNAVKTRRQKGRTLSRLHYLRRVLRLRFVVMASQGSYASMHS